MSYTVGNYYLLCDYMWSYTSTKLDKKKLLPNERGLVILA